MTREVRAAYDAVADAYARLLPDLRAETPGDVSELEAFARSAGGVVAEIGCGTGRITSVLSDLGLRVVGLDLSPEMVRAARSAHPALPFAVADACALPLRDGVLGGLVSWYSLIHLPPEELPVAVLGFARVLRPGAPVLLAFQCGDGERVERETSYGLPVRLTYYRHRVEHLVTALKGAGLDLRATVVRDPALPHETTSQAFVHAVRAAV